MLLILYKPKGNIENHKDLLVDSAEAEDYLQDFPGSICVGDDINEFGNKFSTRCYNGMFEEYKIRNWLVPKKSKSFILLEYETVNL